MAEIEGWELSPMQVTAFLRQQGFENVMNMAGGIDRWGRELNPGMKRY